MECHKVLAAMGATKVSAYVTHGVFPNQSWKRFAGKADRHAKEGFANFWLTDSCPKTAKEVENIEPFAVMSLASSIAAALQI